MPSNDKQRYIGGGARDRTANLRYGILEDVARVLLREVGRRFLEACMSTNLFIDI